MQSGTSAPVRSAAISRITAVLYANNRNVGDQFSARGIAWLLGGDVRYLPFERRLDVTEAEIDRLPKDALVVIGGGGLLKSSFQEFWSRIGGKLRAERRRFAVWGVGCCREWAGQTFDVPTDVLQAAMLVAVRDDRSAEMVDRDDVIVVPCPSHNLIRCRTASVRPQTNAVPSGVLLQSTHSALLDQLDPERGGHDAFSAACRTLAGSRGLRRIEVDNLVLSERALAPRRPERLLRRNLLRPGAHFAAADRLLDAYASADLVVTSRLHGAIFGAALRKPMLAFSKDPKLTDYLQATGLQQALLELPELSTHASDAPVVDTHVLEDIEHRNVAIADSLRSA